MKKLIILSLITLSLFVSCSNNTTPNDNNNKDNKATDTTDYGKDTPSTNNNETNSNTNQTH